MLGELESPAVDHVLSDCGSGTGGSGSSIRDEPIVNQPQILETVGEDKELISTASNIIPLSLKNLTETESIGASSTSSQKPEDNTG